MPVVRTGKIYVYLLWTTRGIMYIDIAWQAGKNTTAGEEKYSTLRHESTSKQIFSYSENKNMTVEHFKYLKNTSIFNWSKMPITQVCKIRAYEFGLYFVTCNLGAIENVGKHVLL